ncbi:hypothetical protein [Rugosimonospora africana]|uniref:Uncharacterized protein n=1 Tax=Rugosimonospora africana TaxID=556532 RepID=A0A8J3QSQ1_9ACTN|nr:hypothetical protein [Rugosimonospora africana]GIH14948.1 hypothetical protein Raf01_31200 [Rugosimonospora africana]
MTSFPAQARRVRDSTLTPAWRLSALRECTLHFAPYGFRATWHHLVVNARIPRRLDADPQALIRAVDELDTARQLMMRHVTAYAAQRQQEKATGRRVPAETLRWYSWGFSGLAYCPNPELHPHEPLVVVVQRLIDAHRSGAADPDRCLVCGTERRPSRACPTCGVHPGGPAARADSGQRARQAEQWQRIWSRDIVD